MPLLIEDLPDLAITQNFEINGLIKLPGRSKYGKNSQFKAMIAVEGKVLVCLMIDGRWSMIDVR
ncbi:MAG: hypothetical protein DI535_24135 [Citrobacter freundii]|nr:MAG: hypothetical protein DI535_24135 [Citrobacter freundii]